MGETAAEWWKQIFQIKRMIIFFFFFAFAFIVYFINDNFDLYRTYLFML